MVWNLKNPKCCVRGAAITAIELKFEKKGYTFKGSHPKSKLCCTEIYNPDFSPTVTATGECSELGDPEEA